MSKLSYICNSEQIQKCSVVVTKDNGTYHFIRKVGEESYYAYHAIITATSTYFVKTHLPRHLFKDLILSGKVDKMMNS